MTSTHTPLAGGEIGNVRRNLRRVDTIFFAIAAIISLDTVGQIATSGAEAFTWTAVLVVTFLFPYGLVMAELGSAFPQEGGPYVWLRLAFGRLAAGVGTMLYWITNPVWLGGSIAFLAATTWETYLVPTASGSIGDYAFKLVFIWAAILGAIVSLRHGKWFVTLGAIVKVALVLLFAVTVVIYAVHNGIHGSTSFLPTVAGFLGVVPVLMFALVGFEAPNGAAEEMHNPRRDVPIMVATSGVISALCYLVPVLGIVAVVPVDRISGLGGFMDAVREVFSVYGNASGAMLSAAAAAFVVVLFNQGCSWMMASDRVQAVAAADGAFPRWFGAFHPKLSTPVRVNLLSGVVATLFTLAATQLQRGATSAVFAVVLNIAVSTLLMSYLLIFPAVLRLRRLHPDVERPFRVPGGGVGLAVCFGAIYLWVLLGAWQTVAPGLLEHLFGVPYDFAKSWNVSRLTFESFTFGTLAVIVAFALVGYALARRRAPARS
ncbi:APC family permease [Saccharopolyspora rosea]|uniref:APC family permease n=1 Tax=Saccharopolyspora rosea TaxID=524884 RepID=A0ABW3FRT0_9PSEU|nr:APC family permease [Saccharopolyspora rosea]